MKPSRFDYYAPSSLGEAVALLSERRDGATVLAGGQSLIPVMNMRLAAPRVLVDINRIDELGVRRISDTDVSLGATLRQGAVLADSELAHVIPLVTAALRHVGHPQTRARGTVVGSLTHHDPAAELPAVAVALDAVVTAAGRDGTRSIAAEEFFVSYYTTALKPGEIATQVRFPSAAAGSGAAFEEFCRRPGDFALVGVAAQLTLDGDHVSAARLALAAVADRPVRARKTEEALLGEPISAQTIAAAAQLTVEEEGLKPLDDMHASADFRLSILPVIAERAIATAWSRATGEERA